MPEPRSDWDYIRIVSWHIVRTPTRAFDSYITLCGRRAVGDALPNIGEGKSCESCLRLALRRGDPVQVAGENIDTDAVPE